METLRLIFAIGSRSGLRISSQGRAGTPRCCKAGKSRQPLRYVPEFPINPTDAADDMSGTGEGQDRWTLVGNPHDFNGFGTTATIPCFYNPTGNTSPFLQRVAFARLGCRRRA